MKYLLLVLAASSSAPAFANDSCQTIIKRTVQASLASQEEDSVTSGPILLKETNPADGLHLHQAWLVKTNEFAEEERGETLVVTSRRVDQALADGCSVLGIY